MQSIWLLCHWDVDGDSPWILSVRLVVQVRISGMSSDSLLSLHTGIAVLSYFHPLKKIVKRWTALQMNVMRPPETSLSFYLLAATRSFPFFPSTVRNGKIMGFMNECNGLTLHFCLSNYPGSLQMFFTLLLHCQEQSNNILHNRYRSRPTLSFHLPGEPSLHNSW